VSCCGAGRLVRKHDWQSGSLFFSSRVNVVNKLPIILCESRQEGRGGPRVFGDGYPIPRAVIPSYVLSDWAAFLSFSETL
jgi:hypothetical protein